MAHYQLSKVRLGQTKDGVVVQFSINDDEPLHPLAEPKERTRLFGEG